MSAPTEGLVALVTGAASGIGAETAALLATQGCRVAWLDRDPIENPEADLALHCDVGYAKSVNEAVAKIVERFGRLDIVVNNAGVGAQGSIEEASDADWDSVFNVNVRGIARVSRASLPHLRCSPNAAIVNVSSIVAQVGVPRRAVYAASKGAVMSLTLAMAADLIDAPVRVNCVLPGTAQTPWVSNLLRAAEDPNAEYAALEARQPLGRLVTAREIAAAIVYLATPAASATTGTALVVDGGLSGVRVPR